MGDVCYAIIGQIVGRQLLPVRYQPSACLVINSPVETPELAKRLKGDWDGITSDEFRKYLMDELVPVRFKEFKGMDSLGKHPPMDPGALSRLKVYFPDEYNRIMDKASK